MNTNRHKISAVIAKWSFAVLMLGLVCLSLVFYFGNSKKLDRSESDLSSDSKAISRSVASTDVPFDVLQRLNSKTLAPVQIAVKEIERSGFFSTDVTLRVYVRINHTEYTQAELLWNIPEVLSIEEGEEHIYLPENSEFKVLTYDISIRRLSDLDKPEVSVQAKALVRDNLFSNSVIYTLNHESTLEAQMKRRYEKTQLRKARLAMKQQAEGESAESASEAHPRDRKERGMKRKQDQQKINRERYFR